MILVSKIEKNKIKKELKQNLTNLNPKYLYDALIKKNNISYSFFLILLSSLGNKLQPFLEKIIDIEFLYNTIFNKNI